MPRRTVSWVVAAASVLVLATVVGSYFLNHSRYFPTEAVPEGSSVSLPLRETYPVVPNNDVTTRPPVLPDNTPKVAIVIDDLGQDPRMAKALMDLGVPLGVGVLPGEPFSRAIARNAHERGLEVLLHQPMEPQGYPGIHPGPGLILRGMDPQTEIAQLAANLRAVPHVAGVNNHMGSALTEDGGSMRPILAEIKRRNLYFLDSLTTPRSVAYRLARRMGVRALRRQVFLDPLDPQKSVAKQMAELVAIAKRRGSALAIGHPKPETLDVLRREIPLLQSQGISFVLPSALAR